MLRVAAAVVSGLIGALGVLLILPTALLLGADGHSDQELSELRGIILVGVGGAAIVTAVGSLLTLIWHFTWRRNYLRTGKAGATLGRKGPTIILVGGVLWLVAFFLVDMFADNIGADFPPEAYFLPAFLILAGVANRPTHHP